MEGQDQPATEQRADLELSDHAYDAMRRRGFTEEFIRRIVAEPDHIHPRADGRTEYIVNIYDERVGDRYFEVVVDEGDPQVVVTIYERGGK